jgi:Uma2 family endonuclease
MQVHVALPAKRSSFRLRFDSEDRVSEQEYLAFCRLNPDLRVERSSEGEIVIIPPPGGESSYRSLGVATQLSAWAAKDRSGKVFDSSAQYILPDSSRLSPDASWVSNKALQRFTPQQRKEFLRLCPEFLVEVLSPSDRLKTARQKMEQWIANGARLAWLIDGDRKTVYIYRPNHPAEILRGAPELPGEGPVQGFNLDLRPIWQGLA